MQRALVFVALLSASCAPRAPAETAVPRQTDDASSVGADASTTMEAVDGCPADFVAAQKSTCILQAQPSACTYPQGACSCAAPPQCGGAQMMHPPGSMGVWGCSPTKPDTAVRADGCPWLAPTKGSGCQGARSCTYGACFYALTIATCTGGAWSLAFHHSPPPP